MGEVTDLLHGEQFVCRTRAHWARFLGACLGLALAATLALVAAWVAFLVALTLALVELARRWWTTRGVEYRVTTRRVIDASPGRPVAMRIVDITRITVEQNPWGKLLDFGTISLEDQRGGKIVMKTVARPAAVRGYVQDQIEADAGSVYNRALHRPRVNARQPF